MKEQSDAIREQLISAIKAEVMRLTSQGETQKSIAKLAGTNQPFISNFVNDNEAGMNGLSITKLISIANGLGLKINVEIQKLHSSRK